MDGKIGKDFMNVRTNKLTKFETVSLFVPHIRLQNIDEFKKADATKR